MGSSIYWEYRQSELMQTFDDENTDQAMPSCRCLLSSHKISQLSNNKMKHTSTTILLAFLLGTLCLRTSAFARMSKPFLCMRKVQLHEKLSHDAAAVGEDSLFDDEEAAAIDAHDISDPGMEAAAMERAVMLAAEYNEEQMKKNELKENSMSMSKPCIGGAALVKALSTINTTR